MNFNALILAGGRSTRLGRDKAWLSYGRRSLIAHQIATVQKLKPNQIFISAKKGGNYESLGLPVLYETSPDRGPLAAIEQGLRLSETPLLLVLAVDMPKMEPVVLRRLGQIGRGRLGIVPRLDGKPEPLASFYPTEAARVASLLLGSGDASVHTFAQICATAHLLDYFDFPESFRRYFVNWSHPSDIEIPIAKFPVALRPPPQPQTARLIASARA